MPAMPVLAVVVIITRTYTSRCRAQHGRRESLRLPLGKLNTPSFHTRHRVGRPGAPPRVPRLTAALRPPSKHQYNMTSIRIFVVASGARNGCGRMGLLRFLHSPPRGTSRIQTLPHFSLPPQHPSTPLPQASCQKLVTRTDTIKPLA